MPDSIRPARFSTQACGRALAVGLSMATALLPQVASGAQISEAQLSAVPVGSSSASFDVAGMPGLVLTVTELAGATMQGSDLAGYVGLWLGAEGGGGTYQFALSQPVIQVSLSFVALTTYGAGETESLSGLTSDQPTSIVLVSPDGSASLDGGMLTPLAEDSRGSLQWVASIPPGFSQFGFAHNQPVPLQGWVIQQISLTPVPEPAPLALLLGGGLALWQLRRRRWG